MMLAGVGLFFVIYLALFIYVDYKIPENNKDDGTADG